MESGKPARTVAAAEGFRRWSAVYDDEANPMLGLERRFLEPLLPPARGRDVVDLGCGTGRWLDALARQSPHVLIGIDFSTEMLRRAARRLAGKAILVAGNCEAPPLESASADLILCTFVLGYIADLDRFMAQVRQTARPGGDIFLADLHPASERKFGWRRGFRDGREGLAIETRWRPLQQILESAEREELRPVALLDPGIGAT